MIHLVYVIVDNIMDSTRFYQNLFTTVIGLEGFYRGAALLPIGSVLIEPGLFNRLLGRFGSVFSRLVMSLMVGGCKGWFCIPENSMCFDSKEWLQAF